MGKESAESGILGPVGDHEPRPEHYARCQRDKIDGGVREQPRGKVKAVEDAPQRVDRVIHQDAIQKFFGSFYDGDILADAAAEQDIVVLDQQDCDGEQNDGGVIEHRDSSQWEI